MYLNVQHWKVQIVTVTAKLTKPTDKKKEEVRGKDEALTILKSL